MRLRFGIRFNGDTGTISQAVRLAQVAEEEGFDDVWYCQDLMKRNAWVALTAMATATRRVRLGTALVNPFSCDPSELAMAAASLHEISEGRCVLGIGAGEQSYLDWIGRRQARPAVGTREAIGLLQRLLAGQQAPHDGEVFRGWTSGAQLRFPVPEPRIPLYIGGQGPAMLRLMGEIGDGGLPILFPPDYVTPVMAAIRRGAEKAGRSIQEIDVAGCVWYALANSKTDAYNALRPLIAYYGPALRDDVLATIGLTPEDFAEIAAAQNRAERATAEALVAEPMFRLAIVGSPDDVVPQIVNLVRAGITQINIGPPLGVDPERVIRQTGQQVIPRVRALVDTLPSGSLH